MLWTFIATLSGIGLGVIGGLAIRDRHWRVARWVGGCAVFWAVNIYFGLWVFTTADVGDVHRWKQALGVSALTFVCLLAVVFRIWSKRGEPSGAPRPTNGAVAALGCGGLAWLGGMAIVSFMVVKMVL